MSGEVAQTTMMMSEMIDQSANKPMTMLRIVCDDFEAVILKENKKLVAIPKYRRLKKAPVGLKVGECVCERLGAVEGGLYGLDFPAKPLPTPGEEKRRGHGPGPGPGGGMLAWENLFIAFLPIRT